MIHTYNYKKTIQVSSHLAINANFTFVRQTFLQPCLTPRPMDEEGGSHGFRFSPILVGLLGVIAGAIMVATYQLFQSICNCHRSRQMPDTANNTTSQNVQQNHQERPSDNRSRNIPTPRPIPIFRYTKDCNEDMCAVCLGDFKEGEQIRVLPDCLHFFHVPCIDTWLNLHSNCPLCRADTCSPPEQVALFLPESSRTPTQLEPNRLPDFGV
ncbi:hypothetical protein PTKIN_Ptkin13bG0281000 [Pterospermum kingtungense]